MRVSSPLLLSSSLSNPGGTPTSVATPIAACQATRVGLRQGDDRAAVGDELLDEFRRLVRPDDHDHGHGRAAMMIMTMFVMMTMTVTMRP